MAQIIDRVQSAPVAPVPAEQNPIRESTPKPLAPNEAQPGEQGQANSSQNLEAATRREQKLRRETERVARERQEIESLKRQYQQVPAIVRENEQLRSWVQRFYRNPVEVLNEAGVPGDVITQGLLNQPSREAISIQALQREVALLKQQNEATNQKVTESQSQQYTQAKAQIKNDVKLLTSEDPSYETIKANGDDGIDAVVELIEQTYLKDGRLMSVKEATDEVENYLLGEALKLAGINKVKEKLGAPLVQTATTGSQSSSKTPTTLSNRGLPAPAVKPRRSEKERVAAAIAAFEAAKVQR